MPTRLSQTAGGGDNRSQSPTTPTSRGRPQSLQTRGTPPAPTLTAAASRRPQSVTAGSRSTSRSTSPVDRSNSPSYIHPSGSSFV